MESPTFREEPPPEASGELRRRLKRRIKTGIKSRNKAHEIGVTFVPGSFQPLKSFQIWEKKLARKIEASAVKQTPPYTNGSASRIVLIILRMNITRIKAKITENAIQTHEGRKAKTNCKV